MNIIFIEVMKEIKGLTGLRGYAALWVFFLHATWGQIGESYAMKIFRLGGSGVVIFFVLSGFILSYVYIPQFLNKEINFMQFIRARIARVYSLHLFILFYYVIGYYIGLYKITLNDNLYTFFLNLGLIQSWGFTDLVSWNQAAWSISTELFAYLLFPFYIVQLYRLNTLQLLLSIVFVIFLMTYSPYNIFIEWAKYNQLIRTNGQQFAYGLSLVQFQYIFLIGCVLFCVTDRIKKYRINFLALYDVATLTGVSLIFYWCTFIKGDLSLIQSSIASSLIIFGISNDTGLSKIIFGNRIIHFIGKISFSLYLSAAAIEILAKCFIYPLPLWLNLLLCISASTLLYYLIELPAQRFILGKDMCYIDTINLYKNINKLVSKIIQKINNGFTVILDKKKSTDILK